MNFPWMKLAFFCRKKYVSMHENENFAPQNSMDENYMHKVAHRL